MCNLYSNQVPVHLFEESIEALVRESYVRPNLEPRPEIRITEVAPIIRLGGGGLPEFSQVRWSWPGPGGKPVYNFRSEGRRFSSGRCLIPADAFYEFTDPEPPAPKRAKKIRWRFTLADEPWFWIAGLWRAGAANGEDAWTMLTTEPGPDIAPYHSRQIVVLSREAGSIWLGDNDPEQELRSSPAGMLNVEAA